MNLENLEGRSMNIRVVVLQRMSAKEKLIEIGAKEYGCGIMYEDPDLEIEVFWRRVLDENEEPTNLYGIYSCAHAEEVIPN